MTRLARVSFLALLVCAASATAAEHTLTLDAEASRLTFELDSTFHTVEGQLFLEGGEIRFDPESGRVGGEVVIDARRSVTGNASRDEKMHEAVLESSRFPKIVFAASQVRGAVSEAESFQIELAGTVAIHGTRHQVSFPAKVQRDGDLITAQATLTVPFVAWGMEDPSVFLFRTAKEVVVHLRVSGRLRQ